MDHLKFWLSGLMKNMERSDDPEMAVSLIEGCGRACANLHAMKQIHGLMPAIGELKELEQVVELLRQHKVAGGNLVLDGDNILVTYDRCYCPIVTGGMIDAPFFCNCTRGWTKEVFSSVLGRSVNVDLLRTINRGDDRCLIRIS